MYSTPVSIKKLEEELISHLVHVFVNNVLHELRFGFSVDYTGPQAPRLVNNVMYVCQNPQVFRTI